MRTSAVRPEPGRVPTQTPAAQSDTPAAAPPNKLAAKPPISADPRQHRGFDFSAIPIFPGAGANPRGPTGTTIPKDVPPTVREVLQSRGEPLDGRVRNRLETHLGENLGHVMVHADQKAAASAQSVNARAYTVGNHIVFGAGQYQPGTPLGDVLLAHEAAHVAQQTSGHARTGHDYAGLEREANSAALPFLFSMGGLASRVGIAMRSGIRLQRCPISSQKINTPSYFGPDSTEALQNINTMMERGASMQNWVRFGTIVVSFEDPIAAMHSAEAQEAMQAIPGIVKAKIREEIDFLFLSHEKDLNKKEKDFWNGFRALL
jgi:hypothetical protein